MENGNGYREKLEAEFRERTSRTVEDHEERLRALEITNGKLVGIGLVITFVIPIVISVLVKILWP